MSNYENISELKSFLQQIYIDNTKCYAARGFDTSRSRPTTVIEHKGNRDNPFYEKTQLQKIDGSISIPFIYNVKSGEVNGKFLNEWMKGGFEKEVFIGGFEFGDYGISLSKCLIVDISDTDNLNNGWVMQNVVLQYQDREEDQVGLIIDVSVRVKFADQKQYQGNKLINATLVE